MSGGHTYMVQVYLSTTLKDSTQGDAEEVVRTFVTALDAFAKAEGSSLNVNIAQVSK